MAFLPALSYSSDLGFIGGGLMNRFEYAPDTFPFVSYTQLAVIASTRGLFSFQVLHDVPRSFGKDLRTTTEISTSRFLQNQYYGTGNYDKLEDPPEGNSDFYLYNSYSASLDLVLRKPVWRLNYRHLDLWANYNLSYQTPFSNDADQLISTSPPAGIEGGITSALGLGFIWDGRNNEFDPSKGTYLRSQLSVSDDLIGSEFDYLSVENEFRAFVSFFLIRKITWANRILFQNTNGTVPYWRSPSLGGEETLRGFAQNRFLDSNAFLFNTELRTWLFDLPIMNGKIGGTLFFDAGRSYNNNTTLRAAFEDIRYTFGFGGNSSFFTPDFIMRGDVGFSEDGVGLYLTAGYIF
ncbi:BamA/TamA family outer membrane protein [Balneola sp. MJW-20]|uniref:BamA/TamA family outer membrane protein n=1 Tax=Gracilimonas aurantiaca TaxID=3234185 RepID=UPI003464F756